jgi:hypothetical protein
MLTIEQLEEKLKLFTDRYKKLSEQINEHIILSKKLEGAIEAINLLIKEIKEKKE